MQGIRRTAVMQVEGERSLSFPTAADRMIRSDDGRSRRGSAVDHKFRYLILVNAGLYSTMTG